MSRDVEVIRLDQKNTVNTLSSQFANLTSSGADDGGFPILRRYGNDDGMRMVGYIGANELDHALRLSSFSPRHIISNCSCRLSAS